MKRLFTVIGVVVLALAASGLLVAQSDPFSGTWKFSVAKSKFKPGLPYKSETRTNLRARMTGTDAGDVYKTSVQRVNADGSPQQYRYSAKYDGKDYPITGQGPNGADTIAIKRIDDNTVQATAKKASKVLFTTKAVVTKDGSVMTFTSKGTDASGQRFNNVLVYDKQ
jgi:hypothetical protein